MRGNNRYGKAVYFVSSNVNKFYEAREVLNEFGLSIVLLRLKKLEVQSDSVEEVARKSAETAAKELGLNVVTEDAGLFIEALNGFPGPYSSYVHRTLGNEGILKLMKDVDERGAEFKAAVAFAEPDGDVKVFVGVVKGEIAHRMAGGREFGFDPIFIPAGFGGRTFAELSVSEKNRVSHRGIAFRRFAEWYTSLLKLKLK
ncbi:XTP/dITP diphosphatase [Candidatus Bathyarchaeota archaeon]|nr:XTP/dITP diphosphatase [Candidatus Bathyarchaeota archaeon]